MKYNIYKLNDMKLKLPAIHADPSPHPRDMLSPPPNVVDNGRSPFLEFLVKIVPNIFGSFLDLLHF